MTKKDFEVCLNELDGFPGHFWIGSDGKGNYVTVLQLDSDGIRIVGSGDSVDNSVLVVAEEVRSYYGGKNNPKAEVEVAEETE